jgi:hypothetical protein
MNEGRKEPEIWSASRIAVLLLGAAVLGFGAQQLLTGGGGTRLSSSVPWLLGVLVVHDGLLAPLAAAMGWAVTRALARGRASAALPVVGGGLFVAAVLTAVALPAIRAPGLSDNATVLPRDYTRGLAILLALDAVATGGLALLAVVRARRVQPTPPPTPLP